MTRKMISCALKTNVLKTGLYTLTDWALNTCCFEHVGGIVPNDDLVSAFLDQTDSTPEEKRIVVVRPPATNLSRIAKKATSDLATTVPRSTLINPSFLVVPTLMPLLWRKTLQLTLR